MSNNIFDLHLDGTEALAKEAVKLLIEKKGSGVSLYHVSDFTSVTDYYVNATGNSTTHVAALADELCEKMSLAGRNALRVEGRQGNHWLLVDYGDVIVNIFDRESRDFYDLDRLFPEQGRVDISDLIREVDEKFSANL